jgi:hypothetical protein
MLMTFWKKYCLEIICHENNNTLTTVANMKIRTDGITRGRLNVQVEFHLHYIMTIELKFDGSSAKCSTKGSMADLSSTPPIRNHSAPDRRCSDRYRLLLQGPLQMQRRRHARRALHGVPHASPILPTRPRFSAELNFPPMQS